MTTGEYKRHKGLTKENLRDNMTNVELALNTLAEVATTEIARQRQTQGMKESRQAAQAGGQIARNRLFLSSQKDDYINQGDLSTAVSKLKEIPMTGKYAKIDIYIKNLKAY